MANESLTTNTTETQNAAAVQTETAGEKKSAPTFDEMLKTENYQSEFDRRVTKALETAKVKWESDAQERISEAKKLEQMNAEQKAEHERQKAEKKLAEREAAVTKRELTATAKEQLTAKGFPAELSAVLDYSNAENCQKSIEAVSAAFSQAVEKAVNERLKSAPPKMGQSGGEPQPTTLRDALNAKMMGK